MLYSISVMAHPKRTQYFFELAERLGNPPFSVDYGEGVIANALRAWSLFNPEAEWHVVVEDDAIVCSEFDVRLRSVLEAAKAKGCRAASLYYGALPHEQEAIEGREKGFVVRPSLNWGLGICLRTEIIPDALKFVKSLGKKAVHFDWAFSRYIISIGALTYYPIPSLLDHRQVPSLLGGKMGRKAMFFEP